MRIGSARFTWKTNFTVCDDAAFSLTAYTNSEGGRSPAWFVVNASDGECIMHISRNFNLPPDRIAVKDYSENSGALDCLKELGIIHDRALQFIRSGWVEIPVHQLTDKGMEVVQEFGFA